MTGGDFEYADESDLIHMVHAIPTRSWRGWPESEHSAPFDMTPRLVAADFFDELGRGEEAGHLRDTTKHVYWNGSEVRPASEIHPAHTIPSDEERMLRTALWTGTHEGEPLDENFGIWDIHPESRARLQADYRHFKGMSASHPQQPLDVGGQDSVVGGRRAQDAENFWLSRNGHGSGFFDSDDWDEDSRSRLHQQAKAHGESDLYVGDDGRIHAT